MTTDASSRLTARERSILLLIGQGLSSRQIAAALGIAYFTVRKHRSNILLKIELTGAAQLSAYAAALAAAALQPDPISVWPGPP